MNYVAVAHILQGVIGFCVAVLIGLLIIGGRNGDE